MDIQTDGDFFLRVVHGPSGDHTLKKAETKPNLSSTICSLELPVIVAASAASTFLSEIRQKFRFVLRSFWLLLKNQTALC